MRAACIILILINGFFIRTTEVFSWSWYIFIWMESQAFHSKFGWCSQQMWVFGETPYCLFRNHWLGKKCWVYFIFIEWSEVQMRAIISLLFEHTVSSNVHRIKNNLWQSLLNSQLILRVMKRFITKFTTVFLLSKSEQVQKYILMRF